MVAVVQNNKGFSLIEMMIALVILMVSMLGLLSVMVSSINANANNEIRNTAIRLTNHTAEALFAVDFEDAEVTAGNHTRKDAPTDPTASQLQDTKGFPKTDQKIRESLNQSYIISWTVNDTTAALKTITIVVTGSFGGQSFSNEAVIYKHTSL